MADRLRTKIVSGVILVIVFAAGGLVGAALAQPDTAGATGETEMAEVTGSEGSENASAEGDENREGDRERGYWFERAGASPEAEAYIRSEILPAHRERMRALDQDSLVRALESRMDTIGRAWRQIHRELSAYYDPREDSLLDLTRSEIRAVLEPPAQQAYDSIWNAYRSRQDREGERRDDRR